MSDGNQTTTTSTTSTTSTSIAQGQAAQSSHLPVGVTAPPQSSDPPFLYQLPSQYIPTHPTDLQYAASHPGYFYPLSHDPTGVYSPPLETRASYGPSSSSSSGPQRSGLHTQPSDASVSSSSLMLGGEQLQLIPPPHPYTSYRSVPFSTPSSPPAVLSSFPAGVHYHRPAPEAAAVSGLGGPEHSSHHAQLVHGQGYMRRPFLEEEPHQHREPVYQYLEVTSKVHPHSQEQHVLRYTVLPSDHHQRQLAQDIEHLEQEHQRLMQKQKELEATIERIRIEKKQLKREYQLEQELRQKEQQLLLTQQSLWIQQQRMREVVPLLPPPSLYGSPSTVPPPPAQPPQQTFYDPYSPSQIPLPSHLAQGTTVQAIPLCFGPPPSGGKGQAYPHQPPGASAYAERILESSSSFRPEPGFGGDGYSRFAKATGSREHGEDEPESGTVVQESRSAEEAPVFPPYHADVAEFRARVLSVPPVKRRSPKSRLRSRRAEPSKTDPGLSPDSERLQKVRGKLRSYALQALVPSADLDEQGKLEAVKRTVVRVPAVCFNEQKFMDKGDYQVLVQPQSPAVRGQEALARVCFALEQALRLKGIGAAIISDYKFRENYLRQAPPDVLDVLPRPEEEGSHNILMIGPAVGIVCIQVTCVEDSTNSGTVKKQVRETLRQLQKEDRVLRHVLQDLDLEENAVRQVMALPNVTIHQLKAKLEPKTVQILCSALNTTDDLEELLTLDRLPRAGHRHWLSRQSRAGLWEWLDRLTAEGHTRLSVENYLQIFARYTCGWSLPEVWTVSKPRVLVRSWAHAVAETYRRYHLPVLTPEQDNLLHSGPSHVLMKTFVGTGHTCLLKAKVLIELGRGCLVLVFLPRSFTSLKQEYEQLASSNEQHTENVYFWSTEGRAAEVSAERFITVSGTAKMLEELTGSDQETFALFDFANRDADVFRLVAEVTDKVTSSWVMVDAAVDTSVNIMPSNVTFLSVQFETLTRLPSFVQFLINHADFDGAGDRPGTPRSSTQDQQSVRSAPASRGSEMSSNQGLSTDGPFPLFILHPGTDTPTDTEIFHCHQCINQLRSALQSLVPESSPRTDADGTKDETPTAEQREDTYKASGLHASEHSDPTTMTLCSAIEVSVEGSEANIQEPSIEINSGSVPRPLTPDDVAIFVDSRQHVDALKDALDLVTFESMIHPLEDLPHLTGTEKAVVVYVGHVRVSATDTVLQALVSKLCEVMRLCQGQLILAVDLEWDARKSDSAVHEEQTEPFQLDIEDMVQESWKEHHL